MQKENDDNFNLFQKQSLFIEEYEKDHPGEFESTEEHTHDEILKQIGIDISHESKTSAYTNLYHQDFIVEEITKDGAVINIEPGNSDIPVNNEGERTLFTDMVKVGIATGEAVETISKHSDIPIDKITYAGIKDVKAITAQRIAMRDPDILKIKNEYPSLYLSRMAWGKGVVEKGSLLGNRFTLVVRTPFTIGDGKWKKTLAKVEDGFYNFYYTQRFGTPRLISHRIGKAILQGNYKEAITVFMCDTGFQHVPYINAIRDTIRKQFGNWEDCLQLIKTLPYTFRREKIIIEFLTEHPKDYAGALRTQNEQPLFWAYAYASYLFNVYLSQLVREKNTIPVIIPLLFNPDARSNIFYSVSLKNDGINNIRDTLKAVSNYVPWSKKNVCVPKIRAKNLRSKIIENGVIMSFDLPPGAYATTFLSHLFSLEKTVKVAPEWVDLKRVDSKKELGTGTVAGAEKVLEKYIID